MKATAKLHDLGQSLWLDNITRDLLESGTLARYISEMSVTGLTSNPTIFDPAIKGGDDYDAAIRSKLRAGKSGEALFFELAKIIRETRPSAFVLENVKNLRSHDQGRTFQVIHDTLTKALGYTVYYKVIDARSVVPQHRERIFLVGFKERRGFEFPEFPAEGPKLETILEANVPEKYTLTDQLSKISSR